MEELSPSLISPPARANTTAFKYWLYRCAYALFWMLVYILVMRVPGIREAIPAIIKVIAGNAGLSQLNLTNGVVAAFVIITLTRIPPIKGADASIRLAMYERASIPAQQLGFQYLLRGAPFDPDAQILQKVRKAATADDFSTQDIEAVLTPIYLVAEFPRLLKKNPGGMPPLAFPLSAGVVAGLLTAGASIVINGICIGDPCPHVLTLGRGLDYLLHRSYPWVILVCSLSTLLSVLMLIGEYPDHEHLEGYARYRRWGSLRDAALLSMGVLGLMALYVVPRLNQLAPEHFTETYFWNDLGPTFRPVITSFFIGFFVPTWYRGNALRARNDRKLYRSPDRSRIQDLPAP